MGLREKRNIVIHHSLTADGQTVSWDAIRRYHTETNGWRAIGYHFGIELVGDRFEIFIGRMLEEDAAAVKEQSMNRHGVHICLVGNFDLASPPPKQLELAARLVASLLMQLSIPLTRVYGHRDFAHYKTCPGAKFDLDLFREQVAHFVKEAA